MKKNLLMLMMLVMLMSMFAAMPGAYADELKQVIYAGGGASQTAEQSGYDLSISKTIEAVEGKENFFDITLTATTHRHPVDTSTDVVIVLDISNTMNSSGKLDNAKTAAKAFVTNYAANTTLSNKRFGLVTFNTNAQIGVPLGEANTATQANTINNKITAITAPTDASVKYTNIEGGLQLAYNILENAENKAKYRYVILVTDGFPTTYIKSGGESTSEIFGYDVYMSGWDSTRVNTEGYFAHTVLQKGCTAGVDYSNRGAIKAQTMAQNIKNAGINVFSVGVGIGGMSIQKYLDTHASATFSTVDTTGMTKADINDGKYAIGGASDTVSYMNWLKNTIAGGPHIDLDDDRYLSADDSEEFASSVSKILHTIDIAPRTQMREFYALDPMGENIEFLHFFDKDGAKAGSTLTGESKPDKEDTAKYGGTNNSDRINWNLIQSGFKMDGENYVFDVKYRIRLENENAGYATGYDQLTNGTTTLNYHSEYEDGSEVPNGDGTLEYPVPKVEGYHGSLKMIKQDEETKAPLANAEFTLTHFGTACSVCGGEAPISPIVKKTNSSGELEMTNIPSGHEYRLHESGVPDGYTTTTNHNVIVSYGKTYIDQKTDAQLLENGKFVNQSGDPSFVIYNSKAEPVEMKIQLKKTLNGRTMKAGEFSFQIVGKDQNGGDYREIKTNAADGTVTFDKMAFSVPGTYIYTITEVPGSDDTIVYDDAKHTVEVVVENRHDADSTVNKEHYVAKVSVDGGKATEYIGQENVVETIQIANAFTNSVREPAYATIVADKTLLNVSGQSVSVPEGKFVFSLQGMGEGNAVAESAYSDENGVASFGPIPYYQPGVYSYKLSELTSDEVRDPNYVYDTHVYDVTVTVTAPSDLTSDAALTATVAYSLSGAAKDEVAFTNKERGAASLTLSAIKSLSGATLEAGAYEFELVEIGANNAQTVLETVTNDASGRITFMTLTYKDLTANTENHQYVIREKIGSDKTIVYDGAVYNVSVGVSSQHASAYELSVIVTKTVNGETTFVGRDEGSALNIELANAFTNSVRGQAEIQLQASKVLRNAAGQPLAQIANKFAFKLEGEGVSETVYSDARGLAVFSKISYTEPGVYNYTITEVTTGEGIDEHYTYDTRKYDVAVTVSAPTDLKDGAALSAAAVYTLNGTNVEKAEFINARKQGDLTVAKTVVSSIDSDKTMDFSFTVTLGDTSISGVYGEMTFTDGKATFTLKDGQSKTAAGLPAGVEYAVTEAGMGRFVTTKTGETGRIPAGGTATAAFTNTNTTGSLMVTKTVVSPYEPDMKKDFGFIVELDNKNVDGTYGDMTFDEGVAIFTLKHGESKTAYSLPAGVNYTVIEGEMNAEGGMTPYEDEFTVAYQNNHGSIGSNQQAMVTVTNTRKHGGLKITKQVSSAEAADAEKEFEFTVELVNSGSNHKHGDFQFVNGVATIKLKNGETAQANDLPVGVTFIVKEKRDEDFVTTMTGSTDITFNDADASATGRITTAMDEVIYTNTRKTGGLMISKTVISASALNNDLEFEFGISLEDKAINGVYGDVAFANGEGSFTLKAGETVSIKGLPDDTAYTIAEKAHDHYDVEAKIVGVIQETNAADGTFSGKIEEDSTVQIMFVNTHKTGNLAVKKSVTSPYAVDLQKQFHFTVTLKRDGNVDTTINNTFGDMTFENGEADVLLKHNETKTAIGLPIGLTYEVTEAEANNGVFETTVVGGTGSITDEEKLVGVSGVIGTNGEAVEFTNSRNVTAGLRIHKDVVSDNPADQRQAFQMKIVLDDKGITGEHGDITFENGEATVTLTGDSFLFASGLPENTGFTVTELNTQDDGFSTTYLVIADDEIAPNEDIASGDKMPGAEVKGTLKKNTVVNVLFTNTRDTGDLTVLKTVESLLEADKNEAFTFTVELGEDIDKTYNDVKFENGVSEAFTLKHGESKTFTGLPVGLDYTVTETAANGYTTTYTGGVGTVAAQGATAAFTNTRKTGELEVTKTVISGVSGDNEKLFSFTVTLDSAISGTFGGVKFTNGVSESFTLKHGQSRKISGLPLTIGYTVTETNEELFTTTSEGATGILTENGATAAFTNSRITSGSLVVSKEVVSANPADKAQAFTFTVRLNPKVSGTYAAQISGAAEGTTVQFNENGEAAFTLTHGQSMTIRNLPAGIEYIVSETPIEGFTVRVDDRDGTIPAQGSAQVNFTNMRDTGSLTVKKSVSGGVADDNEKLFSFTVKLNQAISGTFSGVAFENGLSESFTLKHGQSKTIAGLPTGVNYEVTEASAEGFTTTSKGAVGTITTQGTTAVFTNVRITGGLTVTKTVVGGVNGDNEKPFGFTVTLDPAISGTFDGVEFKNGVTTFELASGQSKTITGLPTGIEYTVTEAQDALFTTTATGETGVITEVGATAAFTNTRVSNGSLVVSKELVSDHPADADTEFEIEIALSAKVKGTYSEVQFTEGKATIQLKGGESKTITGLPNGLGYTVTEKANDAFNVAYENQTGTIPAQNETGVAAKIINTRRLTSLTIRKTVESDFEADKELKFKFEVNLNADIDKAFGDVAFEDGKATFELKHGEEKVIAGLPFGLTYTVMEIRENGFATRINGTLVESGDPGVQAVLDLDHQKNVVEFVNTRQLSGDSDPLLISKKVNSTISSDLTKVFEFHVELSDPTVSGTYATKNAQGEEGEIVFSEGKAIVTLRDGESISITGLPIGVTCRVTEAPVTGFATTVNGEAKNELTQVLVGGGIAFSFVNERATGDDALTISKKLITPLKSDHMKEFEFRVELADKTISGTFEAVHAGRMGSTAITVEIVNGETVYRLKGGETLTIKGLPIGMGYTVTETSAPGFKTESEGASGMINKDAVAAAVFTNTRVIGRQMLTVSKIIAGTASNTEDVFTFEVHVPDLKDGVYGDMTFAGGVAIVQLKHGEKAVAKGIPVGVAYTVTEVDYGSYTPDVLKYKGELTAKGAEAAFVNRLITPDLPTTGDKSQLALWCALLAMAGAGIVLLKRKRA